MRRQLVCHRSVGIAIDFHQHEARGVIGLLHDVEARHARLLAAGAGVGESGEFEGFNALRLDVDVNVDNQHARRIRESGEILKTRTLRGV